MSEQGIQWTGKGVVWERSGQGKEWTWKEEKESFQRKRDEECQALTLLWHYVSYKT